MSTEIIEAVIQSNIQNILAIDQVQLLSIVDDLSEVLKYSKKIFTFGNGGSAAQASHFATELCVRFLDDRRPLPAISLNTDGSVLTAIGNDYGFEYIFSRQLEALASPGDVVLAFSTSGKSPNIYYALKKAEQLGLKSYAFLGGDGGEVIDIASKSYVVDSYNTARVQEVHMVLIHLLVQLVEKNVVFKNS